MIDVNLDRIQGLILAPTRELSHQIAYVVQSIGEKMNVKVHVSCGGTDARQDSKMLKQGVHIVVGTPGRIVDMMKRRHLETDYIKLAVTDEADETKGSDADSDDATSSESALVARPPPSVGLQGSFPLSKALKPPMELKDATLPEPEASFGETGARYASAPRAQTVAMLQDARRLASLSCELAQSVPQMVSRRQHETRADEVEAAPASAEQAPDTAAAPEETYSSDSFAGCPSLYRNRYRCSWLTEVQRCR